MGTRNLTIVKVGGQVKVAQYCQWDGYPTGQGQTISDFLRKSLKIRDFKKRVNSLAFCTDEYVDEVYNDCKKSKKDFKVEYPEFHRDTGADILELIQKGGIVYLSNSIDFLKDGLFCEYAYELDLDNKTVAVYTGGTKPYKVYTFKEFAKKNAMKQLEEELRGDD